MHSPLKTMDDLNIIVEDGDRPADALLLKYLLYVVKCEEQSEELESLSALSDELTYLESLREDCRRNNYDDPAVA